MIKECKKCESKNLYLEPRIKGQDVMTADMVALKCKVRKTKENIILTNKPKEEDIKWQKLKEFLNEDKLFDLFKEEFVDGYKNCLLSIKTKMQELEAKDV